MPKNWEPPQTPEDAVNTLDKLSDTIQFIQDLTAQPSPPISEYNFSSEGFSGLYFFLGFVQDTIGDCLDAIHKNS